MDSNNLFETTNIDKSYTDGGSAVDEDEENCVTDVLQRLTLNISDRCNMACVYCYANGGRYVDNTEPMEVDVALQAINYMRKGFRRIDHINFFGGEPTLYPGLIEVVCGFVHYLHDQGVISYLPSFGITTNGYELNEDLIGLIKRYRINATVSMDGPREIHDKLRYTHDKKPTYDRITKNIKKLMDVGVTPEFECTYTGVHYDEGFSITDLMDFFYDRFGTRVLHCPPVIANEHDPWYLSWETATGEYVKAVRYSIENLAKGVEKTISHAYRLYRAHTLRIPIAEYCPAGNQWITVNSDSRIYACFMLMSHPRYRLGDVYNTEYSVFHDNRSRIASTLMKKDDECRKCWIRDMCFGCLGQDIVVDAELKKSNAPGGSVLCDFNRAIVSEFFSSVVKHLQEKTGQNRR
jgi:uncharacterized protein